MSDLSSYNLGDAHRDYNNNILGLDQAPTSPPPATSLVPVVTAPIFIPGDLQQTPNNTAEPVQGGVYRLPAGGVFYNSYSGTDIVAQFVLPNEPPMVLGEVQTLSYSMHRENTPVRFLGHTSPSAFVKGPRTIAGSLIFTVFNNYAFYRLKHMKDAITHNLYPVADMLPPFDIVLTFANESGIFSKMKIYGITIVDEGGTMSIDDLLIEQTYSYMARGIQPMTGYYIQGEVPRGIL